MTDQHNPYEDACEAYEASLVAQGYNCGFVEDDAGFEDAHSVAIGAAVEAAVVAERARVVSAFRALADDLATRPHDTVRFEGDPAGFYTACAAEIIAAATRNAEHAYARNLLICEKYTTKGTVFTPEQWATAQCELKYVTPLGSDMREYAAVVDWDASADEIRQGWERVAALVQAAHGSLERIKWYAEDARRSTCGAWQASVDNVVDSNDNRLLECFGGRERLTLAVYIAEVQPDVVLELLARIERLEGGVR